MAETQDFFSPAAAAALYDGLAKGAPATAVDLGLMQGAPAPVVADPDVGFRFGSYGRVAAATDLRGGRPEPVAVVDDEIRRMLDDMLDFLQLISDTYSQFEADQRHLHRTLALSSEETTELNRRLRNEGDRLRSLNQRLCEIQDMAGICSFDWTVNIDEFHFSTSEKPVCWCTRALVSARN